MSSDKKGVLYMIPCPIGEAKPYEVLPLANREVIRQLDYFIVENLRSARRFLSAAEIDKPIDSLRFAELDKHNPSEEMDRLIEPIINGLSAGVISEAGVPGVADPGAEVVAACHRKGIRVVPLVGPSSIILAMMASGLNGQSFAFNGYLPIKMPERSKAIRAFERRANTENQAQAFIETPYRNLKLFDDLLANCSGSTMLTIAADILEPTEFILTLPITEWKKRPKPEINKCPAIFIIN